MSNATQQMTLTDFLLARIAEDESLAQQAAAGRWPEELPAFTCSEQGDHVGLSPPRVLAECEAKRRIVELAREAQQRMIDGPDLHTDGTFHAVSAWMGDVLRRLAAVYADHPDYREEWA